VAVTSAQIWAELGNPTEPTGPDLTHLTLVTGAVNAYVAALPIVENVDEWPDDVTAGAVLLGARLYVRRNSPNGIVTFQEMGATYVSRYDSDIARLLRIDKFAPGVAI
jgi:hypothetical protein